ncbi:hypothetical protein PQX77_006578, partial [Marasmius sp. AFHP31]
MIEIRPGTYQLDPDMTRQWDTLERWLRTMVNRLKTVSDPDSGLMVKFDTWPYPAGYGYMSYTSSKRNVQDLATGARDTFIPLIATCTFFILVCLQKEATDSNFDWRWQVSQHQTHGDIAARKVHATWIHDLMDSFAGDVDAERIGAIFDPTNPATIPFLRLFKLVNMPTILYWGTIAWCKEMPYREQTTNDRVAADAKEALAGFGPRPELINRLLAEQSRIRRERATHGSESSETRSTAEHSLRLLDISERVRDVPLCPESGQRVGELIRDFLERRRAKQREREVEESESSRCTRLQREREAAHCRAPGKKGPRVWYWEKVHLGEGEGEYFRVRTLLTRGDADSYWTTHSPSQMVFDSWQNCWDICSDLGDDPESEDFDDYDDDFNAEGPHLGMDTGENADGIQGQLQTSQMEVDQPSSAPELEEGELEEGELREDTPLSTLPATSSEVPKPSTLTIGAPELDEVEVSTELILRPKDIEAVDVEFSHTILSLAFMRYGFLDYPVESETSPESWRVCRSALGNGCWLDQPASARFAEADPDAVTAGRLRTFFGRLYGGETTLNASFDLYSLDSALHLPHNSFVVTSRKIGDDVWYELMEHGGKQDLSFLVPDPLNILQLFREGWGPKLVDVALQFVRNGIEFHQVIPGPPMPTTDDSKGPSSSEPRLGYRPNTYKPDKGDFLAYVSARNKFLRGSRGKIALCQGGILARLAREVVGEDSVVDGPDSTTVFSTGRCFFAEGETGYWGDSLTEAEIDLICGVYYCATRWTTDQRGNKFDNTHRSWFPRPNAFHHGSFNIGFWSKDAEKWYQHRLEECQNGCPVVSAAKWREGMVLNRHVRKIYSTCGK